jgi:hypothetical protein
MLSLPIGCMKFLCPKTVYHHFWPGLIPHLWTGGPYFFMLLIISERVCPQFLFSFFRRRHLIGPSSIFLEHGALPNIET